MHENENVKSEERNVQRQEVEVNPVDDLNC